MRRFGTGPSARGARRTVVRVLAVTLAVVLAPVVWVCDDLLLGIAYASSVTVWAVVALRRWARPENPADAYARALGESSALHLHLDDVRVAAVHQDLRSALVTVTWRSATTVLLDADGRPRGEVARNALTADYTLSIPVHDPWVLARLSGETRLGRVSVYGTTDLVRHPHGTLRDSGVVLDQFDLDFPSWSGSLPMDPELAAWES